MLYKQILKNNWYLIPFLWMIRKINLFNDSPGIIMLIILLYSSASMTKLSKDKKEIYHLIDKIFSCSLLSTLVNQLLILDFSKFFGFGVDPLLKSLFLSLSVFYVLIYFIISVFWMENSRIYIRLKKEEKRRQNNPLLKTKIWKEINR